MATESFGKTLKKINALKVELVKFDLKNMQRLSKALQMHPEKLPAIHITGSNGKGSTSAFITSILLETGYRTGTYISPHVTDIRERIQLNGKKIPKKDFARIAAEVFSAMKKNRINASYFEVLTAIALKYFEEKKTDFVVAEVGLGGRLDATNVLNGKVNVFTSISLEHTKTLGNTIEKIAGEKSGIIKLHSVTVVGKNNKGLATIKKIAEEKKSAITEVDFKTTKSGIKGQEFDLLEPQKMKKLRMRMIGLHQNENAALAAAAALELEKLGYMVEERHIRNGLLKARNPGRLEIVKKKPLVVIDCAHNLDGFLALKKSLELFGYEKLWLVFACMDDKEWKKMIETIRPDKLILTKVNDIRALEPKTIKKIFQHGKIIKNPRMAIKFAQKNAGKKDLVLVAGSVYLAGEALKCLKVKSGKPLVKP